MNRKPLFIALALAATGANAFGNTWENIDEFAYANLGDQVVVGISYETSENCDKAGLFVIGNADVSTIGLVVDSINFGVVEAYTTQTDVKLATLDYRALSALKAGKQMAVVTDQGTVYVSLRGSTRAINQNLAVCRRMLDEAVADVLKPIQPTRQSAGHFTDL